MLKIITKYFKVVLLCSILFTCWHTVTWHFSFHLGLRPFFFINIFHLDFHLDTWSQSKHEARSTQMGQPLFLHVITVHLLIIAIMTDIWRSESSQNFYPFSQIKILDTQLHWHWCPHAWHQVMVLNIVIDIWFWIVSPRCRARRTSLPDHRRRNSSFLVLNLESSGCLYR